nr:MAG TPA: hypothetical protein [Caudoviricetes sp.]
MISCFRISFFIHNITSFLYFVRFFVKINV